MTPDLPLTPIAIGAAVVAAIGLLLVMAGLVALWRRRPWRFAMRTLTGLALLLAGAITGALAVGLEGYRRLTHEELVARVHVVPTGPQRFSARFTFPQSHIATFELTGDEITVEARILKWTPQANLLGLHTVYSLDRVAGRYRAIDQERSAPRSVQPLGGYHAVDLFEWRRRVPQLARFFDAEYGSASFVPADRPVDLELHVTTSGLIFRPAPAR